MKKPNGNVVALVASDDTPHHVRGALEDAGYDVPVVWAQDFRGATTAFSTFVETYKPDVIVLDLHPPADEALKDILTFKSTPAAEGSTFIFTCSDKATHAKLPENVSAINLTEKTTDELVRAVKEALSKRRAA